MSRTTIVFASKNSAKIESFRAALARCKFLSDATIIPVTVDSGVSAQPFSQAETRRGALNRCRAALALHPTADYAAAAEGGVEWLDDSEIFDSGDDDEEEHKSHQLQQNNSSNNNNKKSGWIVGWCAILRRSDGCCSFGSSARLPLPKLFEMEIRGGKELSEIIDAAANASDLRSAGGVESLLTNCGLLRGDAYTQGFVCALARFVSPNQFWVESAAAVDRNKNDECQRDVTKLE